MRIYYDNANANIITLAVAYSLQDELTANIYLYLSNQNLKDKDKDLDQITKDCKEAYEYIINSLYYRGRLSEEQAVETAKTISQYISQYKKMLEFLPVLDYIYNIKDTVSNKSKENFFYNIVVPIIAVKKNIEDFKKGIKENKNPEDTLKNLEYLSNSFYNLFSKIYSGEKKYYKDIERQLLYQFNITKNDTLRISIDNFNIFRDFLSKLDTNPSPSGGLKL